jgi:hypothetical protein
MLSWEWRWRGRVSRCVPGRRLITRRLRPQPNVTTVLADAREGAPHNSAPRSAQRERGVPGCRQFAGCGGGRDNAAQFATEARSAKLLWRPPPRPHFRTTTDAPRSRYAERGAELWYAPPRATVVLGASGRPLGNPKTGRKSPRRTQKSVSSTKITEDTPAVHPKTTSRNEPSAGIRPPAS